MERDPLRGLDAWIEGRHITDDPRSPYYNGPEPGDDGEIPVDPRDEAYAAAMDAAEAAAEARGEARGEADDPPDDWDFDPR